MSNPIGWCTETWNPITGCSLVSEGCRHCYALRMAMRLAGRFGYPADDPFRVTFHPDRLDQPIKWKKPRRVFVCSMGDLFHEDVQPEWIARVWDVMFDCPQHTFLVLTKRPERMRLFAEWFDRVQGRRFVYPNVWLGVTVENQWAADERIPILLDAPAAHRFVSCEPLLGRVDLGRYVGWFGEQSGIDWVIAGGESGPGARPSNPDWFRSLRDQCQVVATPFYLKDNPGTIDGVEYREVGG